MLESTCRPADTSARTMDAAYAETAGAVKEAFQRYHPRLLASDPAPGHRLQIPANRGFFLVVFALHGGTITDAWHDGRPAVLDASPGDFHVFDLRYAWSLKTTPAFEALVVEVPCATLSPAEAGSTPGLPPILAGINQEEAADIVGDLCGAAAELLRRGHVPGDAILQRLVHAIVSNLRFGFCRYRIHPPPCKHRLASWQEQRIRTYVAANLTEKIRVSDVSRRCGMSCSHFSRLFKNTVGVTLHQWVMEQRINEAKRLLIETNAAISEIASVTGFADQAHFSRVFSRTTHATPMAWRRVRKA